MNKKVLLQHSVVGLTILTEHLHNLLQLIKERHFVREWHSWKAFMQISLEILSTDSGPWHLITIINQKYGSALYLLRSESWCISPMYLLKTFPKIWWIFLRLQWRWYHSVRQGMMNSNEHNELAWQVEAWQTESYDPNICHWCRAHYSLLPCHTKLLS